MSLVHDHTHLHHADHHVHHAEQALNLAHDHEHVHGPGCGHINVYEDDICARGICGHIEHMAATQRDSFRQRLGPDFFDEDDDDEDDESKEGLDKLKKKPSKLKKV